jgi:hypothetical protein
MKVIVYTSDQANSGNVLECGFDKFFISDGGVGIAEPFNAGTVSALPNPFNDEVIISYDLNFPNSVLKVSDISGRTIEKNKIVQNSGNLKLGSEWEKGIYFITISNERGIHQSIKVIKAE